MPLDEDCCDDDKSVDDYGGDLIEVGSDREKSSERYEGSLADVTRKASSGKSEVEVEL